MLSPRVAALIGIATLVSASTDTTNGGGNILPTHFPVTEFPVPTQTHFPSPSCTKGASDVERFTVNWNFDTITGTDPVVATSPIGVYNLLSFDNINHVHTDPDLDGNHLGLTPYTYPMAATFSLATSVLGNIFNPQAPAITIDYPQSTLSSFTPKSFYYGCVLPSPITAGSLPSTCTITASGFNGAGKKVASQEFHFQKNGSVVQNQNPGTFHSGFKNIRSLNFGTTGKLKNAALIDNFIATLEQDACAPLYTGSYNYNGK